MSRKASNLVELARHGIRVPRGFHLGPEHYRAAIAPVRAELIAASLSADSARQLFKGLGLPAATAGALQQGLAQFPPSSRFAVRSSGNIVARGQPIAEDGGETSLAGQFESFLNVPREGVGDALRQCWASLFNKRSIDAFGVDAGYVDNSTMTVLVQEMVVAAASAVVMTVDPLADGRVGGIELTVGPCEAIVAGRVNPDEVTFSRADGSMVNRRIGNKQYVVEYDTFARGSENTHLRLLASDRRERMAVADHVLHTIIAVACQVERIFGVPQDIELVVDDAEQITVVQARPITRLPAQFIPFSTSIQ